ncbi:MAG: ABC transporter ATP-binding protein [Clostridiaceae bacterium]|jgi:putative ABC transport system ATP-binding protein|nr:ABC transporter ATP-binding protein [Clostridiaceae bacterium]
MTIIRAEDISRSFRTGNATIDVLKSINLDMERGTFNILMGPSGSGKTTLLNILGALDRPDTGKVFIDDQDITGISERKRNVLRRSKLGFVFQSLALVSNMTAFENIDFALRISKYNGRDRRKRVEECLDFVGLKKRMKHYPGEMSGGEQQRIAIARAVAHKPMLLLADEPTAELDTNTGLRVVKLFKDLVTHDNITVIMCTHDPSMMTVADRIFMLEDGVINDAA